jgi:predicted dehydrogenase
MEETTKEGKKIIRIGIVGCGRAAQHYYFPACKRMDEVRVTSAVDVSLPQAKAVAAEYGVPHFTDKYEDLFEDRVDAVILVIPHHLHAKVAIDFLERGISVLCEKPMATTYADALRMVEASHRGHATLAVSLMRRYYPGSKLARELVANGFLGRVRQVDAEDGFIPSRPPSAQWLSDKTKAGGGVLISDGIHVLDLALWILGGDRVHPKIRHYEDDGFSGVEANSYLDLDLADPESGVFPARFRFSVVSRLRNTIIVTGTKGSLELPIQRANHVMATLFDSAGRAVGGATRLTREDGDNRPMTEVDYFAAQVGSFIADVIERKEGFSSGQSHLEAMRLIDESYSMGNSKLQPWEAIVDLRLRRQGQ